MSTNDDLPPAPLSEAMQFEADPMGRNWYNTGTLLSYARAAVAAERERCVQVIRSVKDRSGVNEDGQTWLMRATRADFIDAISPLPKEQTDAPEITG